jgi:hypothetical protein
LRFKTGSLVPKTIWTAAHFHAFVRRTVDEARMPSSSNAAALNPSLIRLAPLRSVAVNVG